MRIFAYREGDRRLLGVEDGAVPRNLTAALDAAGVVDSEHDLLRRDFFRPQRLVPFLKRWRRFAPRIAGPVKFDVPVKPGKVLLVGRNFAEHARELMNAIEDELLFFAKVPESLLPHGGTIQIPEHVKRADHEAELAVVVARDGARIPPSKAFSFVAGYTCLLDVTARDEQHADKAKQRPWLRSKSYDTFCPIGPYLVPLDDVLDPGSIDIVCRVNGTVRQAGNTRDWLRGIPEVLATISNHTTLRAGDVIALGTPAGVGPLVPGDTVEVEITGIGCLQCRVDAAPKPAPPDKVKIFTALRLRIAEAITTSRDGGEAFERVVALLDGIPHFHWTGIYRVEPDGTLGLGPFRGRPTAHVKIEAGKGLCGRAAAKGESVVVGDVTEERAYLACSSATRSEIVVPILVDGRAVAEIDVDSDDRGAFDDRDREFLEDVAGRLASHVARTHLPRMWEDR